MSAPAHAQKRRVATCPGTGARMRSRHGHHMAHCEAGRWHFCSQAAADRQQLNEQLSKWQAPGLSGYSFSLSPFPPSLSSLSFSIFSLYNCCHLVASDICLSLLSLLPILGCGLRQGSSFRRKVSLAGWCPMLHPPIIKGVWCWGRFALNYRARVRGPQH